MRSVCHTIVAASRALMAPSANRTATRGKRSRNATPRYICPDALPWLIPCAAATSATASQLSHDHWAQSVGPLARRRTSSAIAASLRAAAAASTCAHPVIAATTSASSACLSASTVGSAASNIISILCRSLRQWRSRNPKLWTNFQLWIIPKQSPQDWALLTWCVAGVKCEPHAQQLSQG